MIENHSFLYFVNYILRNVITVKTVGVINKINFLVPWLEKNGFEAIFEFSSDKFRKSEKQFRSKVQPDAIIAYDPFSHMSVEEIEESFETIDSFKSCLIIAIENQNQQFTKDEWKAIFAQFGQIVEIYSCEVYTLFLVVKK